MNLGIAARLRAENPVLSKDLRTRMRGSKAFLVQGFYAGLLALMMGLYYLSWWIRYQTGASPLLISSDLGRGLYLLIFETQAALVALITPALTAGTITLEREQRTYELLACTRLAPRTILAGKLLSGWLFVVMLVTCSLPLAAVCLMFGGVSFTELVWSYVMLCLFALLFGSIGVLFSAVLARSMQAVLLTYGSVGSYLIATFAADPARAGVLWTLNPFAFVYDSMEKVHLFSVTLPGWVPGLIILPLASLLLLDWGIGRLPHFVADRALAVRVLLALLMVAIVSAAVGGAVAMSTGAAGRRWFGGFPGYQVPPVLIAGATIVLLMSLFFATGEGPSSRPRSLLVWLASGLDPRRMFSSELRGGWAYLLLLAALFSLIVLLAPGVGHAGPPRAALATFIVLGSVLLCFSALGALGAALNSRTLGLILILVVLALTQFAPGIIWTNYVGQVPAPSLATGADHALYLAPYVSLSVIYQPGAIKSLPPPMASTAIWKVTAVIYLVLAALAFALAEAAYQVRRRRELLVEAEVRRTAPTGG